MARIKKLAGGGTEVTATTAGETISGSTGDDIISAIAIGTGNTLKGGNGRDTIFGSSGADIIEGGNGKDVAYGNAGNDILYGDSKTNLDTVENGADKLLGGSGNDIVFGGNGPDVIYGDGADATYTYTNGVLNITEQTIPDGGYDYLVGGNGPDRFVYVAVKDSEYYAGEPGSLIGADNPTWGNDVAKESWDIITDFQSGTDKIDLSTVPLTDDAILFGVTKPPKLQWSGDSFGDTVSGEPNPDRAYTVWTDPGKQFIYADTNGDGKADMKIQVSNVGPGDLIGVNSGPVDDDESASVTEDVTTSVTGSVLTNATDLNGDDLDVQFEDSVATIVPDYNIQIVGDYGTLYVNTETGAYRYDLDNANPLIQQLGEGDSLPAETFAYTVTDGFGGSDESTLMITITGTNDAPVLTVDTSGGVTEDVGIVSGNLADSGTLSFTDVDVNDLHTVGAVYNGDAAWTGGPLTAAQITAITSGFSADSNSWDYSVSNAALNFLGAGETITLSFNVTVTDDSGASNASDTETVTVTINGTNDAPIITSNGGGVSAMITIPENTTAVTTVTATDVDAGATQTYSISGGADATRFTINASTGVLSFVSAPDFEAPTDVGANHVYDVQVTVSDGLGGVDTQALAVTVTNVNEVAVGENVITDQALGSNIVIPEWALLFNDNEPVGNGTLDVTAAGGALDGTVSRSAGTGTNGTVTFVDTSTAGGSFTYSASDGGTPDTTTVTVSRDAVGTLDGTAADNILISAQSGTTLIGGDGSDVLISANGNDTYQFDLNDGRDVISDNAGNPGGSAGDRITIVTNTPTDSTDIGTLNFERVGNDLIIDVGATDITVRSHYDTNAASAVENINFTNGGRIYGYALSTNDYALSTDNTGALDGPNGNSQDVIASASPNGETLNGNNSNDLLFGNGGVDILSGGTGSDLLVGGAGIDTMNGGGDKDWLVGGADNDILSGGGDIDTFVMSVGGGLDSISDFERGPGGDILDLSDLLAPLGGVNAGNVGNYVNLVVVGANTEVQIDSDGLLGGPATTVATLNGTSNAGGISVLFDDNALPVSNIS